MLRAIVRFGETFISYRTVVIDSDQLAQFVMDGGEIVGFEQECDADQPGIILDKALDELVAVAPSTERQEDSVETRPQQATEGLWLLERKDGGYMQSTTDEGGYSLISAVTEADANKIAEHQKRLYDIECTPKRVA